MVGEEELKQFPIHPFKKKNLIRFGLICECLVMMIGPLPFYETYIIGDTIMVGE